MRGGLASDYVIREEAQQSSEVEVFGSDSESLPSTTESSLGGPALSVDSDEFCINVFVVWCEIAYPFFAMARISAL